MANSRQQERKPWYLYPLRIRPVARRHRPVQPDPRRSGEDGRLPRLSRGAALGVQVRRHG